MGFGGVRIFSETRLSQFGKLLFYKQAEKEKEIIAVYKARRC